MKFIFIIQGEGRGHLTQALSLKQLLEENGHTVLEILIGKSKQRIIPDFFYTKSNCYVTHFEEPNFAKDKKNKGVNNFKTIFNILFKIRQYKKSIDIVKERVDLLKPDAIINFYSFIGGLYNINPDLKIPFYCIGHQYLFLHSNYNISVKNSWWKRISLNIATKITSINATKKLALSFYELENDVKKNVYVIPPLLRKEIVSQKSITGQFFLCYVLNDGYVNEIKNWHKQFNNIELHIFSDGIYEKDDVELQKNLYWHKINDEKFIKYLTNCKGFASTAGFESICEAMYLNKPVLLVPTANHIEQEYNSFDAIKTGNGIRSDSFNIENLIYFSNNYTSDYKFKNWINSNKLEILKHITKNNS